MKFVVRNVLCVFLFFVQAVRDIKCIGFKKSVFYHISGVQLMFTK